VGRTQIPCVFPVRLPIAPKKEDLFFLVCPGFHGSVTSFSKNIVVGAVREPPLDKTNKTKKGDHDIQFGYSLSQIDTVEGLRLFPGRRIFCDCLYKKSAMPLWRDYRGANGVE
jgi:hypothetical protein